MRPREFAVDWQSTSDAEFPLRATIDGHEWSLRLNDFPAELAWTLRIDGIDIEHFDNDDWPPCWIRPRPISSASPSPAVKHFELPPARPSAPPPPRARSLPELVAVSDTTAIAARLSAGADLESRDGFGMTALEIALRTGNFDIADTLHAHGASVESRCPSMPLSRDGAWGLRFIADVGAGDTLLLRMIRSGLTEQDPWEFGFPKVLAATQWLVAHGASLDARSDAREGVDEILAELKNQHTVAGAWFDGDVSPLRAVLAARRSDDE